MRMLVTGGAGFIGSHFIRHILEKYPEYEVVNLDKLTYCGNLDNTRDFEKNPKYEFVKGDICDKKLVARLTRDVDAVVNFAAETHVDRSIVEAGEFVKTDVFGTYSLLEAARKNEVGRYLQISSDETYGSIEKGSFRETDPLNPNSPYSASKAGADMLVRAYHRTHGLPAVITRSSNNYGSYQYPEKLIPLFITNLIENKQVPVYGAGLNVRDWLFVTDNCEGIDLVLHKGRNGEIYNIGGGFESTNIEITKRILKLMNKPESMIKFVEDRKGHDFRYSLDCTKIKGMGWKPKVDFDRGLKATVEWYVSNEAWWKRLKRKHR